MVHGLAYAFESSTVIPISSFQGWAYDIAL